MSELTHNTIRLEFDDAQETTRRLRYCAALAEVIAEGNDHPALADCLLTMLEELREIDQRRNAGEVAL